MSDYSIFDKVIIKNPFFWQGENLGGKEGHVVDTTSYILVHIKGYHSNPVKCFSFDLQKKNETVDLEEELNDFFSRFAT